MMVANVTHRGDFTRGTFEGTGDPDLGKQRESKTREENILRSI